MNDQPLDDDEAADSSGSEASWDEAAGIGNNSIENQIARWLQADLKMLADDFWREWPAEVKNVSLQKNALLVQIKLPFRNPLPSEEGGEWLSSQKDIDRIRIGFADFLRENPSIRKRLANLFYSEFHTFLMAQTKRFHFSDAIREKIERSTARRLAGRPQIPIPERAKEDVKKTVRAIHKVVLEMQTKVKSWKKRAHNISNESILKRLKTEYDREQYPWTRSVFVLQELTTLPGKRAYQFSRGLDSPHVTRPSVAEPERWSTPDIAAVWTQTWFYREYGERYDLRAIKKLLNT